MQFLYKFHVSCEVRFQQKTPLAWLDKIKTTVIKVFDWLSWVILYYAIMGVESFAEIPHHYLYKNCIFLISDAVLSVYSDQREGLLKFSPWMITTTSCSRLIHFVSIIWELCGHWTWEDNSEIGNAIWILDQLQSKE